MRRPQREPSLCDSSQRQPHVSRDCFPGSCLGTTDSVPGAASGRAWGAAGSPVGAAHAPSVAPTPTPTPLSPVAAGGLLAAVRPAAPALGRAPLSPAAASRLRAAALGPANQTRAFPAGAGQSTARVCWKRETLGGKAITKAFHCRQMLSVCADFSCF